MLMCCLPSVRTADVFRRHCWLIGEVPLTVQLLEGVEAIQAVRMHSHGLPWVEWCPGDENPPVKI